MFWFFLRSNNLNVKSETIWASKSIFMGKAMGCAKSRHRSTIHDSFPLFMLKLFKYPLHFSSLITHVCFAEILI